MRTVLGDVVAAVAALRPVLRAGIVTAVVALATCATPAHAASGSAAVDAYRHALEEVLAVREADPLRAVTAMKDSAKRSLLAAKAQGLDVDASNDLAPGRTDRLRNRLRGVLYVDVKAMQPVAALERVRGIAQDALRTDKTGPVRVVASTSVKPDAAPALPPAVKAASTSVKQDVAPAPRLAVRERPDSDAAFYARMADAERAEKEIAVAHAKALRDAGIDEAGQSLRASRPAVAEGRARAPRGDGLRRIASAARTPHAEEDAPEYSPRTP